MKNNFNKAFTLVELIVVITILAVLATVAFISFQGYTSSSRDSVRLADLKNISKSFELNRTKGIDFPLPDKKVDISSSGTIFQYQGVLSQNILNSDLNIFDGGVDPLTGENYGYAVNSARNKFQIIGFLENSENIANISKNTTFADNSDKYVKSSGDRLGILLDENTNELIVQSGSLTQIDVINSTIDYKLQISDDEYQGYNQKKLLSLHNLAGSCKEILENNPQANSGIYTIKVDGINEYPVYCDMQTDGGGWTLVIKRKHSTNNVEECGTHLNDFLQNTCNDQILTIGNYLDNFSYSLGEYGFNIHSTEYMVQQYSSGGVFDQDDAYILTTTNNLFPDSDGLLHIGVSSICSIDKTSCDSDNVIWKIAGNYHFNSALCNGGIGISYGGDYGYCHNGSDANKGSNYFYDANSFLGDRTLYNEVKLWGYSSDPWEAKQYQEFIYVR